MATSCKEKAQMLLSANLNYIYIHKSTKNIQTLLLLAINGWLVVWFGFKFITATSTK